MQVLIKPVYTEFAHLGPGPDISDGPPGHVLVQGLNKFTHNFQKLTQVTGLDSLDLLVTDAPEEVITLGLVRHTHTTMVVSPHIVASRAPSFTDKKCHRHRNL